MVKKVAAASAVLAAAVLLLLIFLPKTEQYRPADYIGNI